MTDERYVYNTDIRERRCAASGARAKKGGSRSKRCTMPSDHMTSAQRRKLNGKPETVNVNRPMTYDQLMELSPTMQFLYLDHLVTYHHARRADLAAMLGTSNTTVGSIAKRLPGKLEFSLSVPKRHPAPEWVAFLEAANAEASQPPQEAAQRPDESTPAVTPEEPAEAHTAQPAATAAILAGSVTVHGTVNDMLAAILRLVDAPEQEYTFTVSFTK